MSTSERVVLAGSKRAPVAAADIGEPVGSTPIEVTLVLRRRAELPADLVTGPMVISREELAERYGADPADVAAVEAAATAAGLQVVDADAASRRVRVGGPADAAARLFGTDLREARSAGDPTGGDHRSARRRSGPLYLPGELAGIVVAVLGLDDRPQSRAQSRIAAAGSVSQSYQPPQLAQAYDFPGDLDGTGQTIAIIELGGGYQQSDLDTYFTDLGVDAPTVKAIGVDGGSNQGGQDPGGADGEVLLDIEVAGAIAPKSAIVVYFAPNTDDGFHDAVAQAAHASPAPTAISISWGGAEDGWTPQARTALDQACQDAAALGVTIVAAAGDGGSSDGQSDGAAHCDFPASSPHVLACGGTTLAASGATISSETVWNDGADGGATGGGVSSVFVLPDWQRAAGVPAPASGSAGGRGVPDVAGNADPRTGYQVLVDGTQEVIGGTSAVAPLWSGLIARLAQSTGKPFGLLQPALYAGVAAGTAAPGFRDITAGSNGDYRAAAGWDPCTGLGSPDGAALLRRLSAAPPS